MEIILIYTPKDKESIDKFEEEVTKNFGKKVSIRLKKYTIASKDSLFSIGQNLAERFFNEALGIRAQEFEEGESYPASPSTPSFFMFTNERMLAECYVYAKMFKIENFPAVIVDDTLIAEGRIPSLEELSLRLEAYTALQKPQAEGEALLKAKVEQEIPRVEAEPLRVYIKPEGSESPQMPAQPKPTPKKAAFEEIKVQSTGLGLEGFDEETKRRIAEILNRTKFRGPDECTLCLYFIESENRCALLHVGISDPKRPICRMSMV